LPLKILLGKYLKKVIFVVLEPFYILISGLPPCREKNYEEVRNHFENFKLEFEHQNWKFVSDEAKYLFLRMLSKNLKTGPEIQEFFHDY
jgi:hypothetical protein